MWTYFHVKKTNRNENTSRQNKKKNLKLVKQKEVVEGRQNKFGLYTISI